MLQFAGPHPFPGNGLLPGLRWERGGASLNSCSSPREVPNLPLPDATLLFLGPVQSHLQQRCAWVGVWGGGCVGGGGGLRCMWEARDEDHVQRMHNINI